MISNDDFLLFLVKEGNAKLMLTPKNWLGSVKILLIRNCAKWQSFMENFESGVGWLLLIILVQFWELLNYVLKVSHCGTSSNPLIKSDTNFYKIKYIELLTCANIQKQQI